MHEFASFQAISLPPDRWVYSTGSIFELTGVTRKVAAETIHPILAAGGLVLLSPLGFSPTGEVFNLTMEDVATVTAAIALHADKLIFITETPLMMRSGRQ